MLSRLGRSHDDGDGRCGEDASRVRCLGSSGRTPGESLRKKSRPPARIAHAIKESSDAGSDDLGEPVVVNTTTVLIVTGAFLASAVEMVEALTIVLGVGVVRGWRSTLIGVGAAMIVLAVLVAALGPALGSIPIGTPRLVVGALLLAFGLQWLRKAILRSSGYKPLHDEEESFQAERTQAAAAVDDRRAGLDWYSFTVAFKGVLLEGLEVVFIVIAFGSAQGHLGLAAAGAAAALVVVVIAGVLAKGPLSRVSENTIKFAVGLLLTSFGSFWGAEGVGVHWPGDEASLLGVIAFFVVVSLLLARALRRRRVTLAAAGAGA
jgi:uncharacterized membrane protein